MNGNIVVKFRENNELNLYPLKKRTQEKVIGYSWYVFREIIIKINNVYSGYNLILVKLNIHVKPKIFFVSK